MIRPDRSVTKRSSSAMSDARSSNSDHPQKTIFGIKTVPGFRHTRKDGRVQVGRKFENPIPEGSGKEAQARGPWKSPWAGYPGIPTNKYTWLETQAMQDSHNWVMQNVYETTAGPSKYVSTYEGWNSTAAYSQTDPRFERDHKVYIENARFRDDFLRAVKAQKTSTMEMKRCADRWLNMKTALLESPEHMFWLYEDLTYYHTKIHVDYGLAPIAHMCLRADMVEPPKFNYSTFNIVASTAFEAIAEGKATKTLAEVKKMAKKTKPKNDQGTPCENPDKCKCNRVFHLLYSTGVHERATARNNMIPNERGVLDVHHFRQHEMRIVVECSDACGCSARCPRRRLQQGQTKRCVVFYENDVLGFGLRAAEKFKKGELICEYTGEVLLSRDDDDEERDGSYDAALKMMRCGKRNDQYMVIDSSKIGNLARFMSHACSPTAALIETHSRVYESDTLIPRISVYALKDIEIGEKITISYYQESQLKSGEGIPCGCRPGCPNHLPMQ